MSEHEYYQKLGWAREALPVPERYEYIAALNRKWAESSNINNL